MPQNRSTESVLDPNAEHLWVFGTHVIRAVYSEPIPIYTGDAHPIPVTCGSPSHRAFCSHLSGAVLRLVP